MDLFIPRHADEVTGMFSCWDRVVIASTIPGICFAQGKIGLLNLTFRSHLGDDRV